MGMSALTFSTRIQPVYLENNVNNVTGAVF